MKEIDKISSVQSFTLKDSEFVKDINSNVYIYEHDKTGAKLMYIENNDVNKTFTIGFKTPPIDNTGVMHILEHSVLCGSSRFPTKEPFVELCKGSLNTFLNAMTYSDKTVYPVASTNEKDFFNLMHVYLDAVFYPNIYKNDKILKQEGWHYHIENPEDEIDYKGVVYNEMKGYFSSPINRIFREVEKTLYPDNNYAFESGGNPNEIPDLTYEQFINTHKRLYHPSNAYIVLYGDLDIEKAMNFIDEEYLSNFNKKEIYNNIEKQVSFNKMIEHHIGYPITNESQLSDTYIAFNLSVGDIDDLELSIAMNILSSLLIYSEEAPLKQAIIDAGLADDVFCIYESEVLQPYMSIVIKGTPLNKKEELQKVINDTLKELISEGINKDLIEGCLNSCEFAFRELDNSSMPKGLNYSLSTMGRWIHGVDPVESLKFEGHIKSIKKSLTEPYFEDLIERYLLNNNHSSFIVLEPVMNLSKEEDDVIKSNLELLKNGLTSEELDSMVQDTLELLEYQAKEDSIEDLEKIPMLSIEDLDKEVEDLTVSEYNVDGIRLLHYDTFTSGINYVSTIFDTRAVKEDDLFYIGLLSDLVGRVNTNNRRYADLSNDIMKSTGGIHLYTKECLVGSSYNEFIPVLECSLKVLTDKTEVGFDLLKEIFSETNFEDAKRIKELIVEKVSDMEMSMISHGDSLAVSTLNSYFNPVAQYAQYVTGIKYYEFLKDILENIDEKIGEIKANLYSVKDKVFNLNNLLVTFVGDKNEVDKIKSSIRDLKAHIDNSEFKANNYSFNKNNRNEGLLIPSEVQYVAQGYDFKELGYEYTGSMEVLKNVLRYGYLWNKIRVQGGAYGARFNINTLGSITLCSYRDPNIAETFETYKNIPSHIKDLEMTDRELTKAIIGAVSGIQLPLSSAIKGKTAISYYLMNKTKEERQQQRDEVLNTNIDDLRGLSLMFEDVLNQNSYVVVGNDKINENKDLFKSIYSPLE